MKTSIETINGELCTVVKRPFDADAVRKSLAMGVPVLVEDKHETRGTLVREIRRQSMGNGSWVIYYDCACNVDGHMTIVEVRAAAMMYALTILPALSKHPKTEDAALPYRYASEGIFLVGTYGDEDYETCGFRQFLEMYHSGKLKAVVGAVDADGNRVEVAIKGE